LKRYLPAELSDDELNALVAAVGALVVYQVYGRGQNA
jgi:uncharacterized protein YqeY